MSDIFKKLESNNNDEVEEVKQKIQDLFSNVKEPWLLNGLYEYYLHTNSVRAIEILINISEPHNIYLLDKISDSIIKSNKSDDKVQALTLLGYVVRRRPAWLSKFSDHRLLKEVLHLLKIEEEIIPLLSALLVLIVLIPMIPFTMDELLNDVFEIFGRLASWNCSGRIIKDQMIHMQVALYVLFLRLYGIYPCNFLWYLRTQYKDKNSPVFIHTIEPMLETVKMNPSLVTNSRENEKLLDRWKKVDVHDVIVECERFSLDVSDTCCVHNNCQLASGFRSRSGTTNSTSQEATYFQSFKNLAATISNSERNNDFFSPSMVFLQQSPTVGGSMATYSPQPEFTHDENIVPTAGSSPPEAAVEATPETTPIIHDSDISLSTRTQQVQHSNVSRTLSSIGNSTPPSSPNRKDKSPFHFTSSDSNNCQQFSLQNNRVNLSPLKLKTHSPTITSPLNIKNPKEIKTNVDENIDETLIIEKKCIIENIEKRTLKQSDTVLNEIENSVNHDDEILYRNSSCTTGGLRMLDSKSIKHFTRRVRRLRHQSYNSECEPQSSTGSSPENYITSSDNTTVRRANSCPEMKKSPVSSTKDNVSSTLDETDEEHVGSIILNGIIKEFSTSETQTEIIWPMPYEHLFLSIFPALDTNDNKNSNTGNKIIESANISQEKYKQSSSIFGLLDKNIYEAVSNEQNEKALNNQLKLIHQQLLFERHRREIHAYKNRCFFAEAKNNQVLEECNSALRDQIQLQQMEIDQLKSHLEKNQNDNKLENDKLLQTICYLENKCKKLENDKKLFNESNENFVKKFINMKKNCDNLTIQKQQAEASLLNSLAEVQVAKEQAAAGERGRAKLEYINKQLLLIGELQLKYKEKLDDLVSLRQSDKELKILKETYSYEIKTLHQNLQEKSTKLEACIQRIVELEQIIIQNEEIISQQKRKLNIVNKEYDEKLKAIESKYQAQFAITRMVEEKCFELWQKIDMSVFKPIRSPDTSSCQEVQEPSDKISGGAMALSELSSPLSCSLASSEGSGLLVQNDIRDVRNLQLFADQDSPSDLRPRQFLKDIDNN